MKRLLMTALCCLVATPAFAQEATISVRDTSVEARDLDLKAYDPGCPKMIAVGEQKTKADFPGWRMFKDKEVNHFLSAIMLYDGEPEATVALAPDEITDQDMTWILQPGRETFIVCGYNATSVKLTQRLPDSLETCTVKLEQNVTSPDGLPVPSRVECK